MKEYRSVLVCLMALAGCSSPEHALPERHGSLEVSQPLVGAESGLISSPLGGLAPPSAWLEGTPDPARLDADADGVPNPEDNCPTIPNPPVDGMQPLLCGQYLRAALEERVFLKSRTFLTTRGVDPALYAAPAGERVHALVHIHGDGEALTEERRVFFEALGVLWLDPLPRNTFLVSMPRDPALWETLVTRAPVVGMSALIGEDRVAPALRLRGPATGYPARLEVDFFEDTTPEQCASFLTNLGVDFERREESTYRVSVTSWQQVSTIASEDSVQWVEEAPRAGDKLVDYTQNSWDATAAWPVVEELGLTGFGLAAAVVETDRIPEEHPEIFAVHGNHPVDIDGESNPSHVRRVGAILGAHGAVFPDRRGYLSNALIVSFEQTAAHGDKKTYYKFPRDAHDMGAVLVNYSSGTPFDCEKLGNYTKKSVWRDRAVREFDILPVVAAGNNVGSEGVVLDLCLAGFYGTLSHDIGKNDLVVGNWNLYPEPSPVIDSDVPEVDRWSKSGPTADGRLKPDVVAPGSTIETIDFDPDTGIVSEASIAGTSAAAAVASGIVGWVFESLDSHASADVAKAILLHTAKDVGREGPDFRTGYGLLQAAPAVRLAREWSSFGQRAALLPGAGQWSHTFQMPANLSAYKVTLVWTDLAGSANASLALTHDLDLTLEAPSGEVFYPWDLTDHLRGAVPGTGPDALNNVEQVSIETEDGSALQPGVWTVRVDVAPGRPLLAPQSFAVALTPPCPLALDADLKMNGDLTCDANTLVPAVIEIVADGVVLDCDNHDIHAGGAAVGIKISANDVVVKNCNVHGARTGIATTPASSGVVLMTNDVYDPVDGILLQGHRHRLADSSVSDIPAEGTGIIVDGNETQVGTRKLRNHLSGNGFGVDVLAGSTNAKVRGNDFSGPLRTGVRLRGLDPDRQVAGAKVEYNHFEGPHEAVEIAGNVESASVSDNDIEVFGSSSSAIVVEPVSGLYPDNPQLVRNTVLGQLSIWQRGIYLSGAVNAVVLDNRIQGVGFGIVEESSTDSEISGNTVQGGPGFVGGVGVASIDSGGSLNATIAWNTIREVETGVEVIGIRPHAVTWNTISARDFGVTLTAPGTVETNYISDNPSIEVELGVGISVSEAPKVRVERNEVFQKGTFAVTGIGMEKCPDAFVSGNSVDVEGVAIDVEGSDTTIFDNEVGTWARPPNIGIRAGGDGVSILANPVKATTGVGLHYYQGFAGVLEDNTLTVGTGIGIRLGSQAPAECDGSINVDAAILARNTIAGATKDLEVLCDVGSYTLE